MAFAVQKFNHSPQWYRDHCHAEDGGSPAFRSMLTADMEYIGADIDSTLTYQERIGTYEERWNAIMEGDNPALIPDLGMILEKEHAKGFRPKDQYAQEPFKTFSRLMVKHNLSTKDVAEFLKWSSTDAKLKKAREAKAKKNEKADQEHRDKVGKLLKRGRLGSFWSKSTTT